MINKYRVLPHHVMELAVKLDRRLINRATDVSLEDPASLVMTDLNEMTPFSIEPTANIDATNQKMIACGVRLLFVTDQFENLLGIVTATDILGEKPVQYIKEHGGNHDDIMVLDIMTPKEKIDVLSLRDVEKACVGDIIETMQLLGRQHTLVVKQTESGDSIICGIFSTSQIGRQLGVNIEPIMRANTFADVKEVVTSA